MNKPYTPEKLASIDVRWEPLIPLIGQANRALAQYDGILHGVPHTRILLSPLTMTQEAVLSSHIEGTQATLGDVLKYDAGQEVEEEAKQHDIHEIVNYRRALNLAEEELQNRPFSLNLVLQLHSVLLDSVRGKDKSRGRFRTVQNWIGRPDSTMENADYVPPEPMQLKEHLDDWEKFYHCKYSDPLVQLAIVHAQFEIIHPFVDGNGRVGRMLIPLFLYEKGLLQSPSFYISAYMDAHRDVYVDHLRALGSPRHWNDWITFFLQALIVQAQDNILKARKIIELYGDLKQRIPELTNSRYAVPVLDQLFQTPIFRSSSLQQLPGNPSRQTLNKLLTQLVNAGILGVLKKSVGSRSEILWFPELVRLCEEPIALEANTDSEEITEENPENCVKPS